MSTVSGNPPVIVVGVDGSAEAAAALSWAIDEARLRQARLNIVHAFPAHEVVLRDDRRTSITRRWKRSPGAV